MGRPSKSDGPDQYTLRLHKGLQFKDTYDILFRGDGTNDRLGKEMIHWRAVTTKKKMIHAIFCSHANPSPLHCTWQRRPPTLLPSQACTFSSHPMRREMPMLPPTRTRYLFPIP